jgi:putative heme degradation protein
MQHALHEKQGMHKNFHIKTQLAETTENPRIHERMLSEQMSESFQIRKVGWAGS